jgi:hypothetical protein
MDYGSKNYQKRIIFIPKTNPDGKKKEYYFQFEKVEAHPYQIFGFTQHSNSPILFFFFFFLFNKVTFVIYLLHLMKDLL